MQDRTGLTVFLVRVVFVLFETRRFCKVARLVFPDLNSARTATQSFFSHFICHLQGFGTCFAVNQCVVGLQIPLADTLQIKYLQAPKSGIRPSTVHSAFMF